MDRDRYLKAMTQFSNIGGTSPINNQILFLNGHDSHFGDRSIIQIQSKNIHTLILKAGEPINEQPNYNGPNSKLNALYIILKDKWMLKYGNTRFQPHHMNSILVETWEAFMVSASNIISDSSAKIYLLPL